MSASLVGSEMCIRDRALPRDLRPPPPRLPRLPPDQPTASPSNRPAQPRTCLLYTSDAADDM
eukprot:3949192-Alexandrium_andersonii.AAC.1